jgi:Ca2+-binding EF-hand superfamily protein
MMITINSKKPRPDSIDYREYLSDKVIEELDLAFREADDGNGTLDKSEIMKIFKERGISFTPSQMDAIFSQVDADGSGAVSFSEFCNLVVSLTGTRKRLNAHEFLDDDEMTALRKAFQEFDHSGDGSIDTAELTTIFRTMGLALAEDKEHEVVTKYDVDGGGEMEFDEFVTMMVDLKKMRKKRNINPTTIQAKQLRTLGFAAKEVRSLGYSPQLMRQDGYTANEMVAAKFTPSQLRHAGFP